MWDEKFEWDDDKARANWNKHRVTFEEARAVFDDPNRIEVLDENPNEERLNTTGLANGTCLIVISTERNQRTRIISARKANKHEQAEYFQIHR